jgi:hypothetical protein
MRVGLSNPNGSKIEAVIANTVRLVAAVRHEDIVGLLCRTCSSSCLGLHCSPSVMTPSALSSETACLLS